VDTNSWKASRTLNHLEDFIIEGLFCRGLSIPLVFRADIDLVLPSLHKRLMQKSKSNGSPTLLFITGAALRATEITRILKSKKLRGEKGGDVAKLFAKHFKLQQHATYLKQTKVGAAVGTPGRIGKLLAETGTITCDYLHACL
jgi:protein CMS1